jgi:rhamnulose-1-phosphate aldolase
MDVGPIRSFSIGMDIIFNDKAQGPLLWISRTGCTMDGISRDPEGNSGLYRIGHASLGLLIGTGPPSTEAAAHVLVHVGADHGAMIHCHWDDIGKISEQALKGSIPEWMGVAPVLPPGSLELARATAEKARDHRFILWPHHGVIASGRDLDKCLGTLLEARSYFDRPF